MSYIPRQIKKERERVEAKLDQELIQQLEHYCRYLESDRDYVISQALTIAFRKDKGFVEWLKNQAEQGTGASMEKCPVRSR
jgi:predicted transcriptional regulator